MSIPPSTGILKRLKEKYPSTWYLEVIRIYEVAHMQAPLSDDAVELRQCMQEALALYARREKG